MKTQRTILCVLLFVFASIVASVLQGDRPEFRSTIHDGTKMNRAQLTAVDPKVNEQIVENAVAEQLNWKNELCKALHE